MKLSITMTVKGYLFMKKIISILAILLTASIGVIIYLVCNKCVTNGAKTEQPQSQLPNTITQACGQNKKLVYGFGYVRGRSALSIRNKYAGFVSKVNYYNYQKVKKGDVIIEYDDLEIRTEIKNTEHAIAEQQNKLELLKIKLTKTRMDPLPSAYRNLKLKYQRAKAILEKSAHEYNVYQRLSRNKIVSDLTYREKMEAFKSSESELRQLENDLKLIQKGLSDVYIYEAETEVKEAEIKLKNLNEKLTLLKEKQKYYKIVAPYDGVTITNSDSVHGYDSVGTAAAVVHRVDRKYVYSYFTPEDMRHIHVGDTLQFISHDKPRDKQGTELKVFDIATGRVVYGDKVYFLVKCRVTKDPQNLLVDTIGTVIAEVK